MGPVHPYIRVTRPPLLLLVLVLMCVYCRNLPRRLLEEAQQKKQRRGGIADGCLLGELWGSATQKPFGEAFGGGLLQVVLRAAASGGSGDALGSSCGSGCNRLACTNEECLSDGLRFIEVG